ncbi:MAG: tyrosine-type recombinase/integrase [Geminicoccaceae bacterium]
MVARAYGEWLGFLARQGALEPCSDPGLRASEVRLRAFLAELERRVAPVTTAMTVGALKRMLAALAPERDWAALARAHRQLKRRAVPRRPGLARIVPAADLLALACHLMDTAAGRPGLPATYRATRFRDGLLISVLIACPIRLRNLEGLVLGQHLIFDGTAYGVRLTAEETKKGRPHQAVLPVELTAYLHHYLEVARPNLQSIANSAGGEGGAEPAAGGRLWLDRKGGPMTPAAIQNQLELRTRASFGRAISRHTFRHCAVSELVELAPEQVGLAADLLGHASFRTTRKHYIHAQGMTAHARVQGMIQRRRRAAAAAKGEAVTRKA